VVMSKASYPSVCRDLGEKEYRSMLKIQSTLQKLVGNDDLIKYATGF